MTDQFINQAPTYQQTSTLAVISLISGIASFFILPLLGAIVAIITGGNAKKEILLSRGALTGLGMAQWGVILGWLNIALGFVGLCLSLLVFFGVLSVPLCMGIFSNGFNFQ